MENKNQQAFHVVDDSATGLSRAIRHLEAGTDIDASLLFSQSEMVAGLSTEKPRSVMGFLN